MKTYTTIQGDTWDVIAFKHFPKQGRELITSILIQHNTDFINTVIFPAGCIINIPDITVSRAKTLPPWMV